jgi:hypothetical protein
MIRTALGVPAVGPGLGAERAEGVVELQDTLEVAIDMSIGAGFDDT